MPLKVNREMFERVKAFIAQNWRINMLSWAKPRQQNDRIGLRNRMLQLLDDCQTTACIAGLTCFLATSEKIDRAAEIYDLSDNDIQEPSILGMLYCLTAQKTSMSWRMLVFRSSR